MTEKKLDYSLIPTIMHCHIKRIGVIRTILGSGSMLISIPLWIIFHLTLATIYYQWLLRPIFKTPKVLWRNFVVLDRNRIKALTWQDKFNCDFCAYANGITTMINVELDNLAHTKTSLSFFQKICTSAIIVFSLPITIMGELFGIRFIYNILVALPLGLHYTSFSKTHEFLITRNYGEHFQKWPRIILLLTKNVFVRFAMLLEQIESAWCPLKHYEEREGIVYPKHHERFIHPKNFDQLKEILVTKGTVSEKTPWW